MKVKAIAAAAALAVAALSASAANAALVFVGSWQVYDPNAPTYQTLAKLRDQPARTVDSPIKQLIDRSATISAGGPDGVTAAVLVPETRHAVASVFWAFMSEELSSMHPGTQPTVIDLY